MGDTGSCGTFCSPRVLEVGTTHGHKLGSKIDQERGGHPEVDHEVLVEDYSHSGSSVVGGRDQDDVMIKDVNHGDDEPLASNGFQGTHTVSADGVPGAFSGDLAIGLVEQVDGPSLAGIHRRSG